MWRFSLLVAFALVASSLAGPRREHHRHGLKASGEVTVDDWVLLAHGSERSLYEQQTEDKQHKPEWTSTFQWEDYHLPDWAVPFNEGPTQAGGVAQRESDGHLHLPLLGNIKYGGYPEMPAGGATKAWAPPVIWEIDGRTGKSVRLYNLSEYGDGFESVVRYTSDGYPVVALYGRKTGQKIVVLDKNSDKVVSSFTPNVEPMLLAFAKTDPPQLIWASLNDNGGVNFDGHTPQVQTQITTSAISTIIFGADGQTIYNNGFLNEATGIYRFSLPLSGGTRYNLFISSCYTKPWIMVSDTAKNNYALCQSGETFRAWDSQGKQLWSKQGSSGWLIMTDDESTLMAGSGNSYRAFDPRTGSDLWSTTAEEAFGNGTSCAASAQPWSPRHPVPIPASGKQAGYLALLCRNGEDQSVRLMDANSGKPVEGAEAKLDFWPDMITIDASNYVYAYGTVNDHITVQRKKITGL